MKPALVLAVGGSEESLVLLHQVLVHLGHSVVLASNGREAVEQSARHRPDVIVLDLAPSGEDPLDTLRALATRGWAATTAMVAIAERLTLPLLSPRFSAVVAKPIVLSRLAEALEQCLVAPAASPGDEFRLETSGAAVLARG